MSEPLVLDEKPKTTATPTAIEKERKNMINFKEPPSI